jgi:hypothetical protein
LACAGLAAQDTRNVTESHFFCRLQFARGATRCSRRTLSDAGENKPDTVRIQDAIDHFRSGQAFELKRPLRFPATRAITSALPEPAVSSAARY